ncbi:hypothetical protein [Curtobacterium sp. MCBA15_001]|uniref:hypothetical protein n=1 Tax=Curtobacterium sp. MCBA15_001 TaxID=1898731 RepID=UPI0008DD112C|nr:hypothetical protein [Curtobacterium sp. MCBA15_001]OIH95444.1 hypothetical protein BIU90_01705 [Curtobacterium sp. MCBA15_001]
MSDDAKIGFGIGEVRAGWMPWTLSHGGRSLDIRVSYISDALEDMLEACVRLLDGSRSATFDWQGEPDVFRWVFTSTGDVVIVRLEHYVDDHEWRPELRPAILIDAEVGVVSFCRSVAAAVAQLLDDIGEERYRQEWGVHFPTALLRRVQRRVVSRAPATLFLGSESDAVTIDIQTGPEPEQGYPCGVDVHSRTFRAAVATSIRHDDIGSFASALRRLRQTHAGEAVLTVADGSCRFVITAAVDGASAHLRGAVSGGAERSMTFDVPLRDEELEMMSNRTAEVMERLLRAA